MKKWPFIVAGLYGLALFIFFGPLLWIAFQPDIVSLNEIQNALTSWWVWAPIGVLVLGQFALLQTPVYIANRRSTTRMPVSITIVAAAFMMGLLVFGAILSIYEFINKLEGPFNPLLLPGIAAVASWIGWAVYFHRATRQAAAAQTIKQLQRFMWTGSILELLIAIPTHIVARNRDYCCAGALTFIGLVCGFSVMLFAFGPALYFLFAERWNRLRPRGERTEF